MMNPESNITANYKFSRRTRWRLWNVGFCVMMFLVIDFTIFFFTTVPAMLVFSGSRVWSFVESSQCSLDHQFAVSSNDSCYVPKTSNFINCQADIISIISFNITNRNGAYRQSLMICEHNDYGVTIPIIGGSNMSCVNYYQYATVNPTVFGTPPQDDAYSTFLRNKNINDVWNCRYSERITKFPDEIEFSDISWPNINQQYINIGIVIVVTLAIAFLYIPFFYLFDKYVQSPICKEREAAEKRGSSRMPIYVCEDCGMDIMEPLHNECKRIRNGSRRTNNS